MVYASESPPPPYPDRDAKLKQKTILKAKTLRKLYDDGGTGTGSFDSAANVWCYEMEVILDQVDRLLSYQQRNNVDEGIKANIAAKYLKSLWDLHGFWNPEWRNNGPEGRNNGAEWAWTEKARCKLAWTHFVIFRTCWEYELIHCASQGVPRPVDEIKEQLRQVYITLELWSDEWGYDAGLIPRDAQKPEKSLEDLVVEYVKSRRKQSRRRRNQADGTEVPGRRNVKSGPEGREPRRSGRIQKMRERAKT